MNAVENGPDVAALVGDVIVEGVATASETGVDSFRATYDPSAPYRTVTVQ